MTHSVLGPGEASRGLLGRLPGARGTHVFSRFFRWRERDPRVFTLVPLWGERDPRVFTLAPLWGEKDPSVFTLVPLWGKHHSESHFWICEG